ncbi:alpha-hydroxy-acid oxidizing protein [Xanthomonas sp. A2111]|uniref:Alpha-hydroxy-acid oxidizing protein n=2 Tax=Xanthomonas TaxID=338 RepID=A0ABU2IAJ1_9XANT|nr:MULTISPECIES: alpha-hydroxy-acid oxidizing protein [unclassified Xanthomonas]MBO9830632.1 alpha-hydroxy-acid oxidizing protein [Xanthomonas sp. A2111]MBO9874433.1 alpha-hydroxy-acid oxidizing protein [Xanthomonas sp. D-93]MDS9995155.1 alpha-hydroxy-acid oxidizing protein [Xanthomonas sp. A2111]WNH46797.1 alpha-hydroxy-acid oxidizing protein [Xanthomonas sp. A6251]
MYHGRPINIADYRRLARQRLPRVVFDYLEGGAEDECGLARNRTALDALCFRPRRLRDVRVRDQTVRLFGTTLAAPLVVGPTGFNDLFWPNGDLALARASAAHGIPFVLSTVSNTDIETLARGCDGEWWFQLYVVHRELAAQLVCRALNAGCRTLLLTVDVPINGRRERDLRNDFQLPSRYSLQQILDGLRHPGWTLRHLRRGMPRLANFEGLHTEDEEVRLALIERRMKADFTWLDLAWLREQWPHRLLVKGILHPEDAAHCAALGIDGVILSNHGARQLDSAVSPLHVLPDANRACALPLLIDSGFRRGSDVVKALALGARAVLLGRAPLYGLAAAGEFGVNEVIGMFKQEIDCTLAQIGCGRADDVSRDLLQIKPEFESTCVT